MWGRRGGAGHIGRALQLHQKAATPVLEATNWDNRDTIGGGKRARTRHCLSADGPSPPNPACILRSQHCQLYSRGNNLAVSGRSQPPTPTPHPHPKAGRGP